VSAHDVLETIPPDDALPPRRPRPALVVLIVMVVVAGSVGLRWSQRPGGWVTQHSRYSATQKVFVAGLDACVQVELSGMLKYERSTAADVGDRHFRDLRISDASMELLFYASCSHGADLIKLRRIHFAQAWGTTGGRAIERRASYFAGPLRGANQYNSGFPIDAHGVTAMGEICVTAAPTLQARADRQDYLAQLHPVTVCGH
jgi:hypothetical protein